MSFRGGAGLIRRTPPHAFKEGPYDSSCTICRMSRNYYLHQPWWWRWFFPTTKYRRR